MEEKEVNVLLGERRDNLTVRDTVAPSLVARDEYLYRGVINALLHIHNIGWVKYLDLLEFRLDCYKLEAGTRS